MKKFIKRVTVTGADDNTDIGSLFAIQRKYPFVEFGILLSSKYSLGDGNNRFPSKKWLNKITQFQLDSHAPIQLSGHICGKWIRDVLTGNPVDFTSIHDLFSCVFERWQLNTHAEPHKIDIEKLKLNIKIFELYFQDVIFQIDGVNNIIEKLQDGTHPNISGLFDLSHGAGVLPNAWPSVLNNVYCGYAGGLSPDNVIDELRKIEPLVGAKSIWIDAETHLRNADGNFDLTKVQAFLENVSPYVVNSIYEK